MAETFEYILLLQANGTRLRLQIHVPPSRKDKFVVMCTLGVTTLVFSISKDNFGVEELGMVCCDKDGI